MRHSPHYVLLYLQYIEPKWEVTLVEVPLTLPRHALTRGDGKENKHTRRNNGVAALPYIGLFFRRVPTGIKYYHYANYNTMTAASKAALNHLKKLKPFDGWSIEQHDKGFRLLRRKVPLTDNYFLDIHHDAGASDAVVGILTKPRLGGSKAYAQVLVDKAGKPVTKRQTLSVQFSASTTTTPSRSTAAGSSSTATDTGASDIPVLTDEQNMQLIKFGAMAIGGFAVLRFVLNAAAILYILALPVLYLYLVQTVPSDESFEAKKQLKRVMRGHHLPDDHPDKPKGFLSETLARLTATVTAEVATGLAGYEVTLISLAGAAKVVCVRVPAAQMDYYWVGAVGRWVYVYNMELSQDGAAS